MNFTFYNEMGSFKLYGSGGHDFTICSVSGLEPTERARSLKTYIGEDGSFEDSSQYIQRVITISADIKTDIDYKEKIRNAVRILSKKCTIIIENGSSLKKITANASSFSLGLSYNCYQTFVIQLCCDYPHFTDTEETQKAIFKKEKLLNKDTVLPAMFSSRVSSGIINNTGDLRIYPTVIITKKDETVRENSIIITNDTTGSELVIDKAMVIGETVTVDIKNRTIKSSTDGNILGALSLYSSLADFWCDCGENFITVTLGGEHRGTEVWITYSNEYLEAL